MYRLRCTSLSFGRGDNVDDRPYKKPPLRISGFFFAHVVIQCGIIQGRVSVVQGTMYYTENEIWHYKIGDKYNGSPIIQITRKTLTTQDAYYNIIGTEDARAQRLRLLPEGGDNGDR